MANVSVAPWALESCCIVAMPSIRLTVLSTNLQLGGTVAGLVASGSMVAATGSACVSHICRRHLCYYYYFYCLLSLFFSSLLSYYHYVKICEWTRVSMCMWCVYMYMWVYAVFYIFTIYFHICDICILCVNTNVYLCLRSYSWIGRPVRTHAKLICRETKRATTDLDIRMKSSQRGASNGAG